MKNKGLKPLVLYNSVFAILCVLCAFAVILEDNSELTLTEHAYHLDDDQ